MHVIKRRTRRALDLMKEGSHGLEPGDECELAIHNNYMMEDLKDKVDDLDNWLNGAGGEFDQDNSLHMNMLADIVMCYDKLESVCERLHIV